MGLSDRGLIEVAGPSGVQNAHGEGPTPLLHGYAWAAAQPAELIGPGVGVGVGH